MAARCLARCGAHIAAAANMEAMLARRLEECLEAVERDDHSEDACGSEQAGGASEEIVVRKRHIMPRHGARPVGAAQRLLEIRRIGHYGIISSTVVIIGSKLLEGSQPHRHPIGERRSRRVFGRLPSRQRVNLNRMDCGHGEPLRHHERDDPSAGAHIEDVCPTLRPSPQERAVGAHFHGTSVLKDGELFESEEIIRHTCL